MGATSTLVTASSRAPSDGRARRTARIGVLPASTLHERPRLLAALEAAYPVRFEDPSSEAPGELDAVVVFGGALNALPLGLPVLYALGEERAHADPAPVELGRAPTLARPLQGAHLSDAWSSGLPDGARTSSQSVLATVDGTPAWVFDRADRACRQLVSVAPAELEPGESLRERMAPGRCLALLALVNFLQAFLPERPSGAPALQAAFVLDDPNLHWSTYGHLRYPELAHHAREHGYHMAIAMSPLDGWFAQRRAVQIFKDHPAQLSLCIHGNDHFGPELGRIATDRQGFVLARHALARAAAFERRTGIPYERVMIPPHEQLTEPAARGLRAGGFQALCVSRAYPWIQPTRPGPAAALGAGPAERGALVGWAERELLVGGLPSLPRTGFNAPHEDLVLRAFLGQPLILYGHHDVLEHGLEVLSDAVTTVEALGDVHWASLAHIARTGNPYPNPSLPDPSVAPRPRVRPLLRRLAGEARDRARIG